MRILDLGTDKVLVGGPIGMDDLMAVVQDKYPEKHDPSPPKPPTEDQMRIARLEGQMAQVIALLEHHFGPLPEPKADK